MISNWNYKSWLQLLWIVVLLVALTVRKNGSLRATTAPEEVVGYSGPTPVMVYTTEGRVDSIVALPNQETPWFFARVEQEILPRYRGLRVEEAYALEVEAVSGATLSSNAVKASIRKELKPLMSDTLQPSWNIRWQDWLAIIVILLAALLPIWLKDRRYRFIQLLLNVAVLGFYTGTALCYASITTLLANGLSATTIVTALLLIVALVYPLFGRKGHYCAWCCPLGSAQELVGQFSKRKWTISGWLVTSLTWFRRVLWGGLMTASLVGVWFDWMNYELFAAFMFQSVHWGLLAFAVITLVLSVFVSRPYCRFVCPTGTLMRW